MRSLRPCTLAAAALALVGTGSGCANDVDDHGVPSASLVDDAVVPQGLSGDSFRDDTSPPHALVVFVDVDGAVVHPGGWATDNAQRDTTFLTTHDATFPPVAFDGALGARDDALPQIRAVITRQLAPFLVDVVFTRPSDESDYVHVVVGGTPELIDMSPGVGGVAPVDAGDRNPNDLAFVFAAGLAGFGYTATGLANAIAHELGHTLGLQHIERDGDVMHPIVAHDEARFGDDELGVLAQVLAPRETAHDACGRLNVGASLAPGEGVGSCDGRYRLVHQTDGNVVLYALHAQYEANTDGDHPLWATNTYGSATDRFLMQSDGNAVLYASQASGGGPLWASGTWGHEGASLAVQDDGNVVVYAADGTALWATGTNR